MRFPSTLSLALLLGPLTAGCGIGGSGHIVSQERVVPAFHLLDMAGISDVKIAKGERGIRVSTDDNLIQYVNTRVEGDVLRIDDEDPRGHSVWLNPTRGVQIVVTTPDPLTDLRLEGSGSIAWDGSGQDSGGTLRLDLSGSGSMDIGVAVEEVDLQLGGSGSVRLHGQANHGEVAIAGSGSTTAFGLALATAHASVSGSGSIEISVRDSLDADVSGSGSIAYRGSPSVKSSVSGSGTVGRN